MACTSSAGKGICHMPFHTWQVSYFVSTLIRFKKLFYWDTGGAWDTWETQWDVWGGGTAWGGTHGTRAPH